MRLWKKLRELSGRGGPLDQVFVTSHSCLFEEEAEPLVVQVLQKGYTLHERVLRPALVMVAKAKS